MHDAKQALRSATRAARRALDATQREQFSNDASARLLTLPEVRRARTVLLYAATSEEADCSFAWRQLVAGGALVLFPRIEDDDLVLAAADDLAGLRPGPFGILEPHGPTVAPDQVDVVVLPGLAFDRRGGRLGMGGGFYDRLLPQLRDDCVRIGFGFACQVAVRVPLEEHDALVDLVVTEAAVHRMTAPPPATA